MEPGQLLHNRYRIERELGRGEFGVVYLAEDLTFSRPVAVKVLLPWAKRNEELRHRLRREARLAAMLHSPHAVQILEQVPTDEGDLAIVMEFLDGRSLHDLLHAERRLAVDRVTRIAAQALAALAEAHGLGVIHRDIKPGNIFVLPQADGTEQVKVLDFGIAKVGGAGGLGNTAKLTQQGDTLGSPIYMSPEQCRGEELTPASDLYSLAVVLYELLAGHAPFEDDNPVSVLLMHNQDAPPPLPSAAAATPIGRAVMRSLEKEPARRFATAKEFAAEIEATVSATSARPSTSQPPTQAPTTPVATSRQDEPAPPGLLVRLQRHWMGLVLLLLLLAAVAGFFF